MNPPGAIEEGAKVATTAIEALKSEPISLALIVMNIIFVAVLGLGMYWLNIRTTARYEAQDTLIHKILEQCGPVTGKLEQGGVLQ